MLRKTAGSRFRRKCEEVWTAGWQQLLDRDRSTSSRGRHTCMHVGSRAQRRRPIRVHAALAGRLADWRLAVVAVPADVSQWVSARGAAGRRARVCRHTDSKHGVCPRAHVWGARRTRRRSSELGAGDDSRDTAGRLRTTRGFIRVCAKNHSRGMHAGSRSNRAFLVLRVRLSVHGPNMGLSTSRRYVTLHAARVWDRQVVP